MEEVNCMPLNASVLETSNETYELEFINLMSNLYKCYKLIVSDGITIPKNDENKIRDILLLNYLNKKEIRNNTCLIEGFRFDKEVDVGDGRVDIKIITAKDFEEFEEFYVIECKRLDGYAKLNNAYVDDGIKRFTTSYKSSSLSFYYPSSYGVNGMIGFVVNKINIDSNMNKIKESFTVIEKNIMYESNHSNVKIFHLMMDFSK